MIMSAVCLAGYLSVVLWLNDATKLCEPVNRKCCPRKMILQLSTAAPTVSPKPRTLKVSMYRIVMLSMLTTAIPDNGL